VTKFSIDILVARHNLHRAIDRHVKKVIRETLRRWPDVVQTAQADEPLIVNKSEPLGGDGRNEDASSRRG